jgi:hypothetical protein
MNIKSLKNLLVVFFLIFSQSVKAESDYFDSANRNIIYDATHCFSDEELVQLAESVENEKICLQNIEMYKKFAEKNFVTPAPQSWYQEPSFIVGGIVVSFVAGSILTYLVVSK